MVRPRKPRHISQMPNSTFFKPAGVPMRNLSITKLNFEEVEALRLKNIKDLSNKEAAEEMDISRSTFQRILNLAYKKVSLALTSGQAIQIEGGNYIKKQDK